ncbi:MAG TPA: hypothetical protein VFU05_16600, partial [Cyclobacteriaceae bacterium]|nr:hypothetical protein [Cyclobacteriaceae bacterium]
MRPAFVILFVCCCLQLHAQVSEIKTASKENSSGKSGKSGSSEGDDSDGGGAFFFDFLFGGIAEWQKFKLQSYRERYPSMVSLDVMMQGGIKPSSYYLLWPRVRGNWGLFSTDFRMNYLIEEGVEGYTHIRTNDWQVLQLNLVTSKFFTFKAGAGYMQEAFNTKESFYESAFLMFVHAPDQSKVLGFEYRFAKDFDTGANPRWELSAQYQHELFNKGSLHGYASAGTVFQKYYNTINVW